MASIHDFSSRLLFSVAGAALVLIVVLYLFEVISRYFFNMPTTWSGETIQYALAVLIFFTLPEITRRNRHIVIDIIPMHLKEPARSQLIRFGFAMAAIFSLIAGTVIAFEALRQFQNGLMTNAANPIPRWWITSVISLGLISSGGHFFRHLIANRVTS